MKIKHSIILLCSAALLMASCDNFLNPESPSSFDNTYIYTNTGDAKKFLLGAYALFCTDDYTSRMSNVWLQNTDVEACAPGANPENGSRRDIWSLQGGLCVNWSEMDGRWKNNYETIDRINQFLEGMAESPIKNNSDMKMMTAEAMCLRAYRYFLLCNFWGDVPYFRDAAKYGTELDLPKTDKNIIYSGMIQDLTDHEGDMYYMDQFSDGVERMNREFALGLIARLALFRAGYGMTKDNGMQRADDYLDVENDPALAVTYTIDGKTLTARTSKDYYELAKAYCQKLIAERPKTLSSDFGKIFRDQCEQTINSAGEVLYEIAFGTGTTNSRGDVGWCIGTAVTASSKGATTVQTNLAPSYYFTFDTKDLRRDITCSKISYISDTEQRMEGITNLSIGKWNRLWMKNDQGSESSKSTGINWPLMRYPDILLMLAEADNEINGGPTELAKNALKEVRRRAFDPADYPQKVEEYVNNLSNRDAFFDAVVNERAWEFGGECLRKFDLVRWNIYGKKITEIRTMINNMGKAAQGFELENPEVAKYADLADVIYYERIGGTIRFLNLPENKAANPPLDAITENADNGYVSGEGVFAKKNWTLDLWKAATDVNPEGLPADYTERAWRGYKDNSGLPVSYLLPIGTGTISASKVLNNNGYGHVFTY